MGNFKFEGGGDGTLSAISKFDSCGDVVEEGLYFNDEKLVFQNEMFHEISLLNKRIRALEKKKTDWDEIFPEGSIYISALKSFNPNNSFRTSSNYKWYLLDKEYYLCSTNQEELEWKQTAPDGDVSVSYDGNAYYNRTERLPGFSFSMVVDDQIAYYTGYGAGYSEDDTNYRYNPTIQKKGIFGWPSPNTEDGSWEARLRDIEPLNNIKYKNYKDGEQYRVTKGDGYDAKSGNFSTLWVANIAGHNACEIYGEDKAEEDERDIHPRTFNCYIWQKRRIGYDKNNFDEDPELTKMFWDNYYMNSK